MPDWTAHLRPRLATLRLSPSREAEIVEELSQHLDDRWRELIAGGASPDEAIKLALGDFRDGNLLAQYMAPLRQAHPSLSITPGNHGSHLFGDLWQDLRLAARMLNKSRAFAVVAIVTLGLGIGAATSIFSVIQNVLLGAFPWKGAERMVFPRIHGALQSQDQGRQRLMREEVSAFAENNRVFDGFIAAENAPIIYQHRDGAEPLYGANVTPGTFEFFGMPPLHGRVMQPNDYEPGAPPVFVMRHKTWRERFNGDPSLLNQTFVLNGAPRTLIGIMPPRFAWFGADVWVPKKLGPGFWFLLGRLRPGVSIQQAEADLTVIGHQMATIHPRWYPERFTVQIGTLGDSVVGRFKATLYTVLAAVGLLLLIACSNVANLMLARATTREKEFALRVALGAQRARLVRLLMVESLLLAMAGAALGTFLAWGGLKWLVAAMPQNLIPAESVIGLNAPVLVFALCVAVLTPLIFGLAPALQSSRPDLNDAFRDSAKGVTGRLRGRWARDTVVVTAVALSLTLLIGAGLLMRSFVALREVHLGFQADHVFQTGLAFPGDRSRTPDQRTEFFRPLLLRLKALPGIEDAAASAVIPPGSAGLCKLEIDGETHTEDWRTLFQIVSEGYFRTLRIEFKQGRGFSEREVNDGRRVAVVNETFARRYLPNQNPIGRRIRPAAFDSSADPRRDKGLEIIGVIGDVKNRGLQVPVEPEVTVPYTIAGAGPSALMVRTAALPGAIINAVRQAVWAGDSRVALIYPSTFEDRLNEQMYAGPRFGMICMAILGCIGLSLVTLGVYSVLAYSTVQKTHEIGIRMALGAQASDALAMVVKSGLRLVLAGIAIGIPLSLVLGRVIGTQLVGVTVYDPFTLVVTTGLLTMTAAIACWIPARRAARVDPLVALRYE